MSDEDTIEMIEQEAEIAKMRKVDLEAKRKREVLKHKIYFVHLRCPQVSSVASITAAIKMNCSDGKANVAFAFCNSEKQPMFSKKDGRAIAKSRLGGKRSFIVPLYDLKNDRVVVNVVVNANSIHSAFRRAILYALEARELASSDYLQESVEIDSGGEQFIGYRAENPFKYFIPSWLSREVKWNSYVGDETVETRIDNFIHVSKYLWKEYCKKNAKHMKKVKR